MLLAQQVHPVRTLRVAPSDENEIHYSGAKSLASHAGGIIVSGSAKQISRVIPFQDITNVEAPVITSLRSEPGKRRVLGEEHRRCAKAARRGYRDCEDRAEVEYVDDVLDMLLAAEVATMPRAEYMNSQIDLKNKMRAILVDWLVEVHDRYQMQRSTLFLAINLLDRYLSVRQVLRAKLQLVGIVALHVAAKFEEINPPSVRKFASMTDGAVCVNDMMDFECSFLVALDFKVLAATPAQFLDHFLRVSGSKEEHANFAAYVLELSILDLRLQKHRPSLLAAAAVAVGHAKFGSKTWKEAVVSESKHSADEIMGCGNDLYTLSKAAPTIPFRAIRRKFSKTMYGNILEMSSA